MTLRTISYGGGVQSSALCVLATQGKLGHVDAALFANVGDDSEYPATLAFVRNIMIPWAADRGLPVIELHRTKRDGTPETLWGRLMKDGSRSLPIPVRMSNGAPGTRSCTHDFKIKVVGKWLKANGASADDPADVMIGISTDEIQRVNNKKVEPYERPIYPLIDLGLDRNACAQIIRDAGLPVPPKSSCFFCPFHRPLTWAELRRDDPDLFAKAQLLEDTLNERRLTLTCPKSGTPALRKVVATTDTGDDEIGHVEKQPGEPHRCCGQDLTVDAAGLIPPHPKDPVWLTRFNKRLSDAIAEAQTPLFTDGVFNDGQCDEGYCWT